MTASMMRGLTSMAPLRRMSRFGMTACRMISPSTSSAGITPQETVSEHAPRLLAGTAVAHLLDNTAPRHISTVPQPSLVVAIDCPTIEVEAGTVYWRLHSSGFDEAMRDELRERAESLAKQLA
jgi:arsenate reductase (thioredoxin)